MAAIARANMNCFKTDNRTPSSKKEIGVDGSMRKRSKKPPPPPPLTIPPPGDSVKLCSGFVSQIGAPTQCNKCFMDISAHGRSKNGIQRAKVHFGQIPQAHSKVVTYRNPVKEEYSYNSLPPSPACSRKNRAFVLNGIPEGDTCSEVYAPRYRVHENRRKNVPSISLPVTPLSSRKTSPERRKYSSSGRSVNSYDNNRLDNSSSSIRNSRSCQDISNIYYPSYSRRHNVIAEESPRKHDWETCSNRSRDSSIISRSNDSSRAQSPFLPKISEFTPYSVASLPRNFSSASNEEIKRKKIIDNFRNQSNDMNEGVVSTMKRRLSEKVYLSNSENLNHRRHRPSHEHLRSDRNISIHLERRNNSKEDQQQRPLNNLISSSTQLKDSVDSKGSSNRKAIDPFDKYVSFKIVMDIVEAIVKDTFKESSGKASKSAQNINPSNGFSPSTMPNNEDNFEKSTTPDLSSYPLKTRNDVKTSVEKLTNLKQQPGLKNASTQELEAILLKCTLPKENQESPSSSTKENSTNINRNRSATPLIMKKDGRKKAIWKKQVMNVDTLRQEAEDLKDRVKQLEELDSYAENIQDSEYAQLQVEYLKHEINELEGKLNDSDIKCFNLLEENVKLKSDIEGLVTEVYEVQDTFREKDALEWRKLKVQLDVINKNCRNYQLKLRKAQLRTAELKAKNEELASARSQNRTGTLTNVAIAVACLVAGYQIISKWK